MIERLFTILIDRTARLNRAGGKVLVVAKSVVPVWGTSGVRILISGEGPAWTEQEIASLFTPFAPSKDDADDLGLDLLSAFFITFHHGGDLTIHRAPPCGPGFELTLPFSPDASHRPELQDDLMEKLFLRFELMSSEAVADAPESAGTPPPAEGNLRGYLRGLKGSQGSTG